jgi:hypothetical protein
MNIRMERMQGSAFTEAVKEKPVVCEEESLHEHL